MSMTLNDEQERALREWYYRNTTDGADWSDGVVGRAGRGLQDAIAPLMQPWNLVGGYGESKYRIAGPDGLSMECGHRTNAGGEAYALAQRVCDLLNESEARQ